MSFGVLEFKVEGMGLTVVEGMGLTVKGFRRYRDQHLGYRVEGLGGGLRDHTKAQCLLSNHNAVFHPVQSNHGILPGLYPITALYFTLSNQITEYWQMTVRITMVDPPSQKGVRGCGVGCHRQHHLIVPPLPKRNQPFWHVYAPGM
jgi:hypothetical protein